MNTNSYNSTNIDAVKLQHDLGEQLARETAGMTVEERRAYMRKILENGPFYDKLVERGFVTEKTSSRSDNE